MLKAREDLEKFVTSHVHGPGLSDNYLKESKKLIGIAMIAIRDLLADEVHKEIMKYNRTIKNESDRKTVAYAAMAAIRRAKI